MWRTAIVPLLVSLPFLELHNRTESEHGDMRFVSRSATLTWQLSGLSFEKTAKMSVLDGLVSEQEAQAILDAVPREISIAPDSVDSLPAYEQVLYSPGMSVDVQMEVGADGKMSADDAEQRLRSLTLPLVHQRILPVVKKRYNCSSCRMCHSLVRRYRSDERMEHPAHFDTQAFITVVVALNSHGEAYTGGLYVRAGANSTKQFVPLQAGEAVVHQYDLEHGVQIHRGSAAADGDEKEGVRFSWIIWLQDRECQDGGHEHWHEADAEERGDPVAMFNLANIFSGRADALQRLADADPSSSGSSSSQQPQQQQRERYQRGLAAHADAGAAAAMRRALGWYNRSAAAGFVPAMFSVANCLLRGGGAPPDPTRGVRWMSAAAAGGNADAAYNMGVLAMQGGIPDKSGSSGGFLPPDNTVARGWFEKGAAAHDAKSHFALGTLLSRKSGAVAGAEEKAQAHFTAAARKGHAQAQYQLARALFVRARARARAQQESGGSGDGDSSSDDKEQTAREVREGMGWLKKAAAQGIPQATQLLQQVSG